MASQLRVILGTFLFPSRAFRSLIENPRSLLAVLALVAAGLSVHALVCARIDRQAMVRLAAEQLAREQGKAVSEVEVEKEATRALNVRRIFGYLAVMAGVPLLAAALGLLLWLLGLLFRQRISFGRGYALAAHLWLPLGLRWLLSIPVILAHYRLDPKSTTGLLKTDLGSLLGLPLPGLAHVDLFWIWIGVLAALAGRAAGWRTWKCTVAGGALWLALGFAGRFLV